ncbi:MAG: methionyl-tRNA formyltransferase [Saprospiraceae bacterium]|nr:methionyl-tRNA formyltransferase [Saprospiraceae bacterium]
MRIIFMGTPEFAVASLDILYNAGYNIVGVITSVDKLGGRGRKTLIQSAVKKYALDKGLNILQPKNLKSPKFNETLKALKADVQIVVAFRMLPEMVWNMPPLGTYNLHGSLLPKYRGAAPINWAIINGEKETGVTTFKLKHAIDTGSIVFQKEIKIYPSDNATDLHNRMMYIGADLVLKTVQEIEKDTVQLIEQDNTMVSHAPKLNRGNTEINFYQPTEQVYNFIRGLSLYPCAWFMLGEKSTKVYKAEYELSDGSDEVNTIKSDNKSSLKIRCQDGYIKILDLQMNGKKRMKVNQFLNGFDIDPLLEK